LVATNHTNEHESDCLVRVFSCPSWLTCSVLAVILLFSLALHFNNLGHPGIKDLDEAYHAVVARSMLDDPLKPTLYATPYLPYDYRNWQGNHVWLHKPPVALWQIAGSFATFGESNFTLRLPSALLSTAAVALTFLTGRSLVSAEAGLIAALLQALSPAITRLVHGQVFSDHVDIAMLFWTEFAVWLLIRAARSGRLVDAAFVGIVQAIAWMTKSYPAGFITLVAGGLYLAGRSSLWTPLFRISFRQFVALLFATVLTAAPWIAWCLVRYRQEFLFEQFHVFQHLYKDIEQFAAPWDRLLADYLQRGLLEWYSLAIVAVFYITIDSFRRHDSKRLLLVVWVWSILVPHVLATSKTPTATLIAWPAAWLAIGTLASDAIRERRPFAVGAMFAAAVLLIAWPQMPRESVMGYGDHYRFGSIALQYWPIGVIAAVIAIVGIVTWRASLRDASAVPLVPRGGGGLPPSIWIAILVIAFAFPAYRHLRIAIAVSRDVPGNPVAFPELGRFVRAKSPKNAVFLVDEQTRGEAIIAMWWLGRAAYPLHEQTLAQDVAAIAAHGGDPFLLSRHGRAEPELSGVIGEAKVFVPPILRPATTP
jgi:4-amino-4-deoxy-L-arabinose transferase-like glycosyltransferase